MKQLSLGFESREDEAAAIKAARAERARKMQLAAEQIGAQDGEHLYELAGMLAVFAGSPSALAMGCTGLQWIGSKKELAQHDRLQCSESTVGRALSRLEAAGIITRQTVLNARGQNAGLLIEIQMDTVNTLAKSPKQRAYYLPESDPKFGSKTATQNDDPEPDAVYRDYGCRDDRRVYRTDGCIGGREVYRTDESLFISNKSNNPLSPTTPTEAAKPTPIEQPVVVVDEDDSQGSLEITPEQRRDIETGAKMLAESIRSPQRRLEERELCWQVACAAVLLEGLHQVRQFVRSAKTHARDEADYYRGTIRKFSEERDHRWHELRKQLPPCPQPKIPTTEAANA